MGTVALSQEPEVLADDVLSAILVVAEEKHGRQLRFRAYDSDLQDLFYRLRQESACPLLECFVFSDAGPVPYSPMLSDSISRLQLAGLLGHENPDYEVLFLTQSAKAYYDAELMTRFTQDERDELGRVGDLLLGRIKPL